MSIEDESIANFQEQDDEGYKHAAPSFDCGDLGDHSLEGEELDFSRLSIDSTREDIQRDSRWANLAQEEMRKYQNQKSQLNLIFDLIGTPEPSDLVFLDDRTRAMLLAIDKKPPKVSARNSFLMVSQSGLTERSSIYVELQSSLSIGDRRLSRSAVRFAAVPSGQTHPPHRCYGTLLLRHHQGPRIRLVGIFGVQSIH